MIRTRLRIILVCVVISVALGFAALMWPGRPLYRATVLSSSGEYVVPCAINDRGQIVGYVQTGEGDTRLFLWERQKGMQDLGLVVGGGLDINNAGQIVGTMIDPNGKEQAFLWDPNGGRQLLGMLGGIRTEATGINDSGQVVGTVEISNGACHAFLWDRARGARDIGEGYAPVINNAGQIIAVATADVLIDANTGADTRMPVFGAGYRSINNNGCVVGYSRVPGAGPQFAMWHSGSQIVKPIPLDREPQGYVINDVNQVLFGQEKPARLRIWGRTLRPHHIKCYLLDPARGVIPLGRYAHAGSDEFFYPVDLNNKGDILLVCWYKSSHPYKAILLEPIPKRWTSK
jgi:probable HAF family extracellular repeat protein